MKKKSNGKIKKAVLKYTRFSQKWKYKVTYTNQYGNLKILVYTNKQSAINDLKRILKGKTNRATLYQKKTSGRGLDLWKCIGRYGYAYTLGKFGKRRN